MFPSVVPVPETLASLGNLLEKYLLRPLLRSATAGTLELSPEVCVLIACWVILMHSKVGEPRLWMIVFELILIHRQVH